MVPSFRSDAERPPTLLSRALRFGMVAACLSACGPAWARDADPPVSLRSGAWLGACDNRRDCAAYGFADDDSAVLLLHLPRGREPSGTLLLRFDRPDRAEGVRLQLGRRGAALSLRALPGEAGLARAALDASAVRTVLPWLHQSGRFFAVTQGRPSLRAVFRLSGASPVLDWIVRAQRRAVEPGPRIAASPGPAADVPDPMPPPAVASLPAVRACASQDSEQPGQGPSASSLSGRVVLWRIPCGSGNFSQDSLFVLDNGRTAALAAFPVPPQFPARAPGILVNAELDGPDALQAVEPSRGLDDCGDTRRYLWDGRRFVLERAQLMLACHGLAVEDWPVVYRAVTER
ncbi:DUF1176 domain-containing protein [Acetobacteraceae bacterium KSS8]|uniref:DUF1176 domain-containing protein n=1 Tax=Endosaccharibacter trunci TaxID=2812733 RepID=A0ABT1W986_9PROT|nr:DUF1176 domain-containing protein [Acetobacteraceae bacterium KSS8]